MLTSSFFNSSRRTAAAGASRFRWAAFGAASAAITYKLSRSASAAVTNLEAVKQEIKAIIDQDEDHNGPIFVRLAWHASGTYNKNNGTGGSNGATMRFTPECAWGANAGLDKARNLLEPVKRAHPDISYADLWTLSGAVAIEYMGGPAIPWREGRVDAPPTVARLPDGLLPAADSGSPAQNAQHIRDIFGRMGFDDREMVALIGAHAVGRCHTDRSGYDGPWTKSPTTFSNEFYRELLQSTWQRREWNGPMQYEDKETKGLMMLPADLALVQDPEFRKYVELYARDEKAFFEDFAKAFQKLEELGVPAFQKPWWQFW